MPEYTLASILPFVRVGLRRVRLRFGFTEFVSTVWTALENTDARIKRDRPYNPGNPDNPEFRHADDPEDLKRAAIEAWLYLQRRSFAIPSAMSFPFNPADVRQLELTKRGREWVDGREPIPELAAEYLAALGAMVPTLRYDRERVCGGGARFVRARQVQSGRGHDWRGVGESSVHACGRNARGDFHAAVEG